MHFVRVGLILATLLPNIPVRAQQIPQATSPLPVTNDPQAVSIVNQALIVAGGVSSITTVADYTASGTITYHQAPNPDFDAGVTISGKDLDQFRMDVTLPTGMSSWMIAEGESVTRTENGYMSRYPVQSPVVAGSFVLPHQQLSAISSSNSLYLLSYKGIVEVDGRSLHEVWAQRLFPSKASRSESIVGSQGIGFYIDVSTFELSMVQDLVPPFLLRRLRYSNYRLVGGVLVPFTIDEEVDGRRTRVTHLSQISFNAGLQDSTFQP